MKKGDEMMDLFNAISRRKSCRKFVEEPFTQEQLSKIKDLLHSFKPLFPDISLNFRFTAETKGLFHVQAPHYLVISGEGKIGEQENAGFIGQQFMLWLNSQELGGVWLGASRDATTGQSGSDIIVLAFGKPEGSPHREITEFKRKDITEITNIPQNECVKAVHLAPSGLNSQPWFLEKAENNLLFYRQRLKPPVSLAYKLTKIDMGIALCHYAIACSHFGQPFNFHVSGKGPRKSGYDFFGIADIVD